jgi:3-hydroxy-9,10-secoandrosta-1,3,5(10)-triene-9,17-dione monooxygenase
VLGAQLQPGPDGTSERILLFLPQSDYRVDDTWHVAGLRGTGSHDIVVADAFVPAYRTQSMLDNFHCRGPGQKINAGPLYRIPFGQIFVHGVSTAAIGALRAMLDAVIANSRDRTTLSGLNVAEDPVAQLACAEAADLIDEATATLHRSFRTLEEYAARGETPPMPLRLQCKFQSAAVVERCGALAARLFKLTGGSGIYDERPFGRILADTTAARQHNANQYEVAARNWGAALLGIEPRRDLAI